MGARYEPVVSLLSPSLAFRAATTKNQWMRTERQSPGQCGSVFDGSRKRRMSSGGERANRDFGGDEENRSLQSRIEEDLNASRDFEKRLKAALEN